MHRNNNQDRISAEELWYLSKDAVERPQKIIYDFFDNYRLGRAHDILWEMFKCTLTHIDTNDFSEIDRSNSFYFYEKLLELLNADYVLYLKMKERLGRK
ncbi:MAG: hypothetical protein BGP13_02015 [Sphingobacteriales bacterium 40-81]|nr:MAG: hypothetical protein BGP13_02015 [Sphingobacteriales bacterium 40-81]